MFPLSHCQLLQNGIFLPSLRHDVMLLNPWQAMIACAYCSEWLLRQNSMDISASCWTPCLLTMQILCYHRRQRPSQARLGPTYASCQVGSPGWCPYTKQLNSAAWPKAWWREYAANCFRLKSPLFKIEIYSQDLRLLLCDRRYSSAAYSEECLVSRELIRGWMRINMQQEPTNPPSPPGSLFLLLPGGGRQEALMVSTTQAS